MSDRGNNPQKPDGAPVPPSEYFGQPPAPQPQGQPQSAAPPSQQVWPAPGQAAPNPSQAPPDAQAPPPQAQRHQVHHAYIWLGGLQVVFSIAIAFAFSLIPLWFESGSSRAGGGNIQQLVIIGLIVAFVVVATLVFVVHYFSYKNLYYELGAEEFSLYSGIFNKKRVHVPYQRVQSVNQRATLIQRILGVCTVHIDTAGGSANKAVAVPYLQNTEAERLRAELFARKEHLLLLQAGGFNGVSPGEPAPVAVPAAHHAPPVHPLLQQTIASQGAAPDANLLDVPAGAMSDVRGVFGGSQLDTGRVRYEFGLSNKELVFTGLSNNTGFMLLVLAFLGTVIGALSQFMGTSFGQQVYQGGAEFVTRSFSGNIVGAIVGFAVALFAVIWIFSVIGTCVSYGGFRASRRHNRVEVQRGLLQHRFNGVDIDRVQSVIIKQSFIKRCIGYCELSLGKIDTLGEGSNEQDRNIGRQGLVIHPFVKLDRVPEILAGLVPEFADVPTEAIRLPKVALRRALVRSCILYGNGFWLAVIVAGLQIGANMLAPYAGASLQGMLSYVNGGATALYILCAIILVFEAVNAVLWFRGSSFAYNRRFMQITNGGLSRESISFPRRKLQFGYVKTNPFQRASHVATVNARTAAGVGGTTLHLRDVCEEDAQNWLDWVRPFQDVVR